MLDGEFPTIITCMTSLRTVSELDPAYQDLEDLDTRVSLEGAALRRSEYLHGLTESVLGKTIEEFGLEPRAQQVIGRGVRDRGWAALPVAPGRVPHVLFVGRIEPRKGVDVLLAAVEELIEAGIPVRLTLAGGPADAPLREESAVHVRDRPKLAGAVRFAGRVSDAELDGLYADADVICLPSRFESHGIALIEAMMHARPILTCATGGIPEVVEEGVNATLLPPDDAGALADALRTMLSDTELRARLGASARAAYEQRFEAGIVAREMAVFIGEVADRHESLEATHGEIRRRLARLLLDAGVAEVEDADPLAGELLIGRAGVTRLALPGARPEPLELDPQASRTLKLLRDAALADLPVSRSSHEGAGEPRVSVVIMTRDRPEFLPLALDSLASQDLRCEVVVIDQASAPAAAAAVVAECDWRSDVRLLRSEVNHGAAGGRNLGVGHTSADLVLFLDDDAELLPGALAHMVDLLENDSAAGAVTATVVTPDGLISHSGGFFERGEGFVNFSLGGFGERFGEVELAPSGPIDWIGGTAFLARRSLLEEFPFDPEMRSYFDDNEWCYRISLGRPGCLRRSREALALHHLAGRQAGSPEVFDPARMVRRLVDCAHFYTRHGLLLGPFSWELLPDRVAADGDLGLGDIRLLMELIAAKGEDWSLAAWSAGELENLLQANKRREQLERTHPELELFRTEVPRLNKLANEQHRALLAQPEILNWLYEREATLRRIEAGGWWRLRGLAQGPLRVLQGLRTQLRRRRG